MRDLFGSWVLTILDECLATRDSIYIITSFTFKNIGKRKRRDELLSENQPNENVFKKQSDDLKWKFDMGHSNFSTTCDKWEQHQVLIFWELSTQKY